MKLAYWITWSCVCVLLFGVGLMIHERQQSQDSQLDHLEGTWSWCQQGEDGKWHAIEGSGYRCEREADAEEKPIVWIANQEAVPSDCITHDKQTGPFVPPPPELMDRLKHLTGNVMP